MVPSLLRPFMELQERRQWPLRSARLALISSRYAGLFLANGKQLPQHPGPSTCPLDLYLLRTNGPFVYLDPCSHQLHMDSGKELKGSPWCLVRPQQGWPRAFLVMVTHKGQSWKTMGLAKPPGTIKTSPSTTGPPQGLNIFFSFR